jgi:hypothetical protein
VVAASATVVPVVLLLGSTPLAVKVVAGVGVYGVASVMLGTIPTEEIRGVRAGLVNRRRAETGVAR